MKDSEMMTREEADAVIIELIEKYIRERWVDEWVEFENTQKHVPDDPREYTFG